MVKTKLLKERLLNPSIDFLKENLQDIIKEEKYLEDPIEGLVPIGDTGLYRTPDEPADPTDCDRYPSSIYCGENPFTRTPIGIEPEIVVNKCDIGIKLTPIFGFIKLPEFNLVYRRPECREPDRPPIETEDGFKLSSNAGCYGFPFENFYSIPVKRILSATKVPGIYLHYDVLVELWEVLYLDCKNQLKYLHNIEFMPELDSLQIEKATIRSNDSVGVEIVELLNKPYAYAYWKRPPYYNGGFNCIGYCTEQITLPPPKEKCCMRCCPPQDDGLTRLLLKQVAELSNKVNKLSDVIGVDEFPASLPESLISKDEGFLGNLIPNANKEVPNLTQFLLWYVERFDEIMGQWEIPIEIKDSDPSKPGDQPLGVKLPNMAEAIGEMFTLAFQTNINTETLLNFAVRSAFEGVTDKQQNFMTYKLLQSLTDWAGYKQKDIKVKMPLLFSLNKTRYDEILQESEIDVAVPDFDEKFGLEADLIRFREAASILAANYKRKVNPNGDIKGQILKHLLDAYAAVNKVNKDEDDNDWDEFVKQVEDGFKNVPGVTNPDKPYGRDYSNVPKYEI